ncbi:lipoyl synthase [Acidimicrobiia bacterium EGI L10123]|uniref:lipoyl synthase n=1 Tax=Salinilacustrithrix flava TaxID=2957203 RepID=UPI003D7C34C5|nr:lipoyl synthase [Acidimicrobiia bacterium EGI L10123]
MTLRIRWLGTVRYTDAHALQQGLHHESPDDHLLLLEHPHVYTLGVRADMEHVLVPPASVGAELVRADRGGDVTYHGPGQLVGYPILTVPGKRGGGMADTVAYVRSVEQLVIDALVELGLPDVGRLDDYPGVWVEPGSDAPRKIAAIGVKLTRGRSMHGFALNVDPDMAMFGHIVPCGIPDKAVTSLAAEGIGVTMQDVVDVVARLAAERWGQSGWERADVVWREHHADLAPFSRGEGPGEIVKEQAPRQPSARLTGRLAEAGVTEGLSISSRKPDHVKAKVRITDDYVRLKKTMRDLDLVTVCEEAGCPNIFECWSDGTATFMVAGERCTRKCGFCLVDTRKPQPLDAGEPDRVAEAVEHMGLSFAVLTMVARDDLADGAAGHVADTIRAIRARTPNVGVEALISDCKGDPESLQLIFDARPDVLNHNIESVARLQRAVRPSAGYARSLSVLARAKAAGLTTKSSIIVGMGETDDEVAQTLADLRGVGVDIVTIGQYLRPTTNHLPVARWVPPETFEAWAAEGEAMGIGHVEASPLTRSSYHARQAADHATAGAGARTDVV